MRPENRGAHKLVGSGVAFTRGQQEELIAEVVPPRAARQTARENGAFGAERIAEERSPRSFEASMWPHLVPFRKKPGGAPASHARP